MEEIDPSELGRALGEVPLFRELQRAVSSQAGPVNWEIAQQVARAVATAGGPGAEPEDPSEFEEACRVAEMRLTTATGLESDELASVKILDRPGWADVNLRGFRPLIDRLAVRLGAGSASEPPGPLQGFFDAVGPLLLGVQVGFLSGYLSRRVLGQYDICFPSGEPGRLYFVYPNIAQVEKELELDPRQFRLWLALHEVAHQLEFQSVDWTKPYFLSLIERYIDSAEIDSEEVVSRLRSLADPEQLSRLLESPQELLPMLMTPAQQGVLGEIQAFMSVMEGYAEWAMDVVGSEMLPEFGKMREGINRRRVERSAVEKMLEQLLGLDLKREQYRAGERFIRAVADAGRLDLLWKDPTYLPSPEEVGDPDRWLERVGLF
jgi:coenzyme F420 biosynthesis associated uncharacterized protein